MVEMFNTNLHIKSSQIESRFLGCVDVQPHKGTTEWYDVVSNEEPQTKLSRLQESIVHEPKLFSKRGVHVKTGFLNHWLDEDDNIGLITDPNYAILGLHARAVGAKWVDDQIIRAMSGNALERVDDPNNPGEYTTQSVALPARSKVNVQTGYTTGSAANTGFNLRKFIAAKSITGKMDADASSGYGNLCLALSQQQLDDLLREIHATGAKGDLMALERVMEGEADQFKTVKIVKSERLLIDNDTNIRTCLMWYEKAVIYADAQGLQSKISEDPSRDDAIKIRTTRRGGAVRLDDDLVVEIPCDEDSDFNGESLS
jgi:hypothetical protein